MHAKSRKPVRMFQWDAVDRGVKMSSKPSKWLFNIIGGRRECMELRERVFCLWIYFHLRSKIFSGPRRAIAPPSFPPPDGSATAIAMLNSRQLIKTHLNAGD